MVNKSVILPVTITLMLSAFQAVAATEDQLNSIKHIGKLNGVALHCKFLTEARPLMIPPMSHFWHLSRNNLFVQINGSLF